MATCPLCWNTADAQLLAGESGGVKSAHLFECKTCGRFVAGWVLQQTKESYSLDRRYLLSALTRTATEEGRTLELTIDSARELLDSTARPSNDEQDAIFLRYIARKETRRGDSVPVDHRTDYPLFFAKGSRELDEIASELVRAGFVQRTDASAVPHYRLTREGRAELQRLTPSLASALAASPAPAQTARMPEHDSITRTEGLVAQDEPKPFDVFLSHASEDKTAVADPLYEQLTEAGCRVWYDRVILTTGDSLRRKIAEGLRVSRYGIVVLSPHFFAKSWPQTELDGLTARENAEGRRVVLPIWHNVTRDDVLRYSAPLADKVAARTEDGLALVTDSILRALGPSPMMNPARKPSARSQQLDQGGIEGIVRAAAEPRTVTGETVQPPPIVSPAKEPAVGEDWKRWVVKASAWLFSGVGVLLIPLSFSHIRQCGAEKPIGPPMPSPSAVVMASPVSPTPPSAPSPTPTPRPVQALSGKQATRPAVIYDFLVEARLSCAAPEGGLPEESGAGSPSEAAYLEGEAGYEELRVLQPARVLRSGSTATLVNRFGMQEASALRGSPISFLLGFSELRLPTVVSPTTHWQCLSMQSYEVTVQLNGRDFWSKRQFFGKRPWQGGGSFGVHLDQLHARIKRAEP